MTMMLVTILFKVGQQDFVTDIDISVKDPYLEILGLNQNQFPMTHRL